MQLTNPLLNSLKCIEYEEVDRCYRKVEYIVNYVHLVHPLFVYMTIPEELHHDHELCELWDLGQKDQADVKS